MLVAVARLRIADLGSAMMMWAVGCGGVGMGLCVAAIQYEFIKELNGILGPFRVVLQECLVTCPIVTMYYSNA
jgi:hypothetical protein